MLTNGASLLKKFYFLYGTLPKWGLLFNARLFFQGGGAGVDQRHQMHVGNMSVLEWFGSALKLISVLSYV